MLAREVGEIALAAEILLHHFHGAAAVDGVPHVRPVDVVPSRLFALLIQPYGAAGGFAAMLNDGQPILLAEPV